MPVKIFVGNISDHARADELRGLFEQFGKVTECDILKNFGFVHMDQEDEANAAIDKLHGSPFAGTKINVEISNSQGKKGRGGGRGGGGRSGRGSRNGYGPMKGGRGGSRGGPYSRDRGYERDREYYGRRGYDDPYGRDPYGYAPRGRSPPPMDMYDRRDPYSRPPRDPYYDRYYERDPYPPSRSSYYDRPSSDGYGSRPPPEYYSRSSGGGGASNPEY